MTSNENDQRSGAFQAGEPIAPADSGESEGPVLAGPGRTDWIMDALKRHERWGVLAAVGIQLLVLFAMIVIGGAKALTGG